MRSYSWLGILGLVLALALVGIAAHAADAPPWKAVASMSGDDVVPPVDTMALGRVVFTQNADGTVWHYNLIVANMSDITAAHIHLGRMGEEGPPVVNLFTGPAKTGRFDGILAEGDFGADALMGPLAGKTMKDLMAALQSRTLYVNVHTVAHAEGEIRGRFGARVVRGPAVGAAARRRVARGTAY